MINLSTSGANINRQQRVRGANELTRRDFRIFSMIFIKRPLRTCRLFVFSSQKTFKFAQIRTLKELIYVFNQKILSTLFDINVPAHFIRLHYRYTCQMRKLAKKSTIILLQSLPVVRHQGFKIRNIQTLMNFCLLA